MVDIFHSDLCLWGLILNGMWEEVVQLLASENTARLVTKNIFHSHSPLSTLHIYYIIFFLKNQVGFFKGGRDPCLTLSISVSRSFRASHFWKPSSQAGPKQWASLHFWQFSRINFIRASHARIFSNGISSYNGFQKTVAAAGLEPATSCSSCNKR